MEIARISNGKLVDGWEGYDAINMMQQLGVFSAPEAVEA
jgi:hypothetical protein